MNIHMTHKSVLKTQKGITIVVALVMLLILTGIGVSTITDSTLQERLSSNSQQRALARSNAQAALVAGEQLLAGMNITSKADVRSAFTDDGVFPNGKEGLYIALLTDGDLDDIDLPSPDANLASPDAWVGNNAVGSREVIIDDFQNSRYIIEYIGVVVTDDVSGGQDPSLNVGSVVADNDSALAFRITAIGYDASANNPSILQSIYHSQQGTP